MGETEKLVFELSLEGLFIRGIGDLITWQLKAELRTLGLDLDRKLPRSVPRETWYAALNLVVKHLFAEVPRDEAHRLMGQRLMHGTENTFPGRAIAPLVRKLGPRRFLKRLPRNMKASNNFATGVITELSATSVQLDVDDVGDAPGVFVGSLERMVAWAGGSDVVVTMKATPPAATYVVSWAE
jgi:uncharacterized protein (TIGR02265 family)